MAVVSGDSPETMVLTREVMRTENYKVAFSEAHFNLIEAAARLWFTRYDVEDWRNDEYSRGVVNLITEIGGAVRARQVSRVITTVLDAGEANDVILEAIRAQLSINTKEERA